MAEANDVESPKDKGSVSSHCYDVIAAWLDSNDWKEWPVASHDSHDRQWFRKYPGEPMCATNEPKPLQLRVKVWDHRKHGADAIGLEVELHAEPVNDGGWVVIKAHAFDGVEEIPNQVERLLVGWRAICSSS